MRDNKQLPFCPVAIKQEPRDASDAVDIYTSVGYNNCLRLSAVDLRTTPAASRDAGFGLPEVALALAARASDVPSGNPRPREGGLGFMASEARSARGNDVSPRMLGGRDGRGTGYDMSPIVSTRTSAAVSVSPPSLADDLKNHIMGLAAASSRDGYAVGKSAWRDAVAGDGTKCTCTECGARFESTRAYRAHRLTHHILMPERRLGSDDRGSNEGGGDLESPVFDEDAGEHGAGFAGIRLAADGSGFACEECKAHFSSRDTYAMHMLLRAKNETCVQGRGSSANNNTTTLATNNSGLPLTSSPSLSTVITPSSTALSVLISVHGSHPEGSLRSPKGVKHEPRSELSHSDGLLVETAGRHKQPESSKLSHELLADAARAADYNAAWWSKYMPWVGVGICAGGAGGGGGVLAGDHDGLGRHMPLVCYLCGEIFANRDSLAMHVLFHTRDMPTALPDTTHPAWSKPLNTTTAMMAMNHTTLKHLQGYSRHNHTPVTAGFNYRRPQSPTETAVASAAAAAAAAVTPATSTLSSSVSSISSSARPDSSPRGENIQANVAKYTNGVSENKLSELCPQYDSVKKTRWPNESLGEASLLTPDACEQQAAEANRLVSQSSSFVRTSNSVLGRGNSAPAPTSLTPLGLNSENTLGGYLGKTLDKHRPLSADHVTFGSSLVGRHLDGNSDVGRSIIPALPGLNGETKAAGSRVGSRSESDYQLQSSGLSITSIYRLQRLKRLRMAKNPYRRPAARGRPPMTIYGTAGRRHSEQSLQNFPSSHTSAFSQTVPALRPDASALAPTTAPTQTLVSTSAATAASSTSGARRIAAMLQLLTSHGHVVSACVHCEAIFADRTLYQLHMGLHNVNNPWQCNACGHVCSSRLHFATHALHY